MRIAAFIAVCAVLGILVGVGTARMQLGPQTEISLPDANQAAGIIPSDTPTPRVSVDSETFDFGTMERHTSGTHKFLFTNVGTAPLRLTVGETTCKCTVGEAPAGLVEPGETVPVTLDWTASTDEAEFRQNATVHTNDPLQQTVRLTVFGKVIEATSYHPRTFYFGDVASGTSETAEIKIVSSREEPLEITSTEFVAPASEEHFDVTVEDLPAEEFPVPEVRAGRRVKVTARPSLPFGPIRGSLKITTNLDRVPEMEVPIAGKVVSDISILGRGYSSERDRLDLGPVNGEKGTERTLYVLLRGEGGAEAELTVAETFPSFLQAELGERAKVSDTLQRVPLVVRVPPGSPPAVHVGGQDSTLGRIVIRTTHPRVPQIPIGVGFTVE